MYFLSCVLFIYFFYNLSCSEIRIELKHNLRLESACYFTVKKLLSSKVLSRNLKIRIYRTIILPVLLYGCETWSLKLGNENKFRLFENKILRAIFGTWIDKTTGEASSDIVRIIKSRMLRLTGHVVYMGDE